jgi:beta-xylosidase
MPVAGSGQLAFPDPSDTFSTPELGLQWGFWHEYDPKRFDTGKGLLRLAARGTSLQDTSVLTTAVGGHSYTVEVDVEIEPGCEAGLLLFYNPEHASGITLSANGINVRLANGLIADSYKKPVTRATLRIVNDDQELDFYFRLPDQPWQRTPESAEISGLHHNVLGGFLDLRPALSAWGAGNARFRNFRYWPEVKLP